MMNVSLVNIMEAAGLRYVPLTAECAGHIVLALADQLLVGARKVQAHEVLLEETGTLRLVGGQACDETECERQLRVLLDESMLIARGGGAGLMRVGRRPAVGSVEQLIKELEVALIPANRAAAKRSLARLYRETARAFAEHPELEARVTAAREKAAALGTHATAKAGAKAPIPAPSPEPPSPEPPSAEELQPIVAAEPSEELSIDVEFTPATAAVVAPAPRSETTAPVAPEPAVPTSSLPSTPTRGESRLCASSTASIAEGNCVESNQEVLTPPEPMVQRRIAAHGHPAPLADIHKTPYLGTVAVLKEGGPARDNWSHALGTPEPALASAQVEGDCTDRVPPVEVWVEPEEAPTPAPLVMVKTPRPVVSNLPERRSAPPPPRQVSELVESFSVSEGAPTDQLRRVLKQMAGVSVTPPPVACAPKPPQHVEARGPSEPREGPLQALPTVVLVEN